MKHKFKIITLLILGTLSATSFGQAPMQPNPMQQLVKTGVVTSTGTKIEVPANQGTNDYSNVSEGNSYEKAVTPLLREISRKKSILEIKKLDKEIAKLDEVEKKEPASNFVQMPSPQNPPVKATPPADEVVFSTPIKVLMTYGAENDLYAKIAVGDQGGYTVKKGDILPDGRSVLEINSNYIEVTKVSMKKSSKAKSEKIFVSAGHVGTSGTNASGANAFNPMPTPSSTMPTLMPIPTANTSMATNIPLR